MLVDPSSFSGVKLRASLPGSVIGVSDRLCLLTVHAHPDDESSKGAGTVARCHAEGVHTVLVCCTGGEEGEILNPALDTPEVHARLAEIRIEELTKATGIIGYDEVVMLGYRDSGMPDSEANANPDSFAQAPLEEAVGRLVAIVRRTRPQVMVVYGDEQSGYPHPDHLRVHDVGVAAFHAAGDPGRFPEAGPPWQPTKLYYTVFSAARFRASAGRTSRPTPSPPRSTSRTTPTCGGGHCWPTPPRSTPTHGSGSASLRR
jgi:mycothiol S-conjugate amidase